MELLTGWSIASTTADATSETIMKFSEEDIIYLFGTTAHILSDNGSCFVSSRLRSFVEERYIELVYTLDYAPVSNVRAERMVGTL